MKTKAESFWTETSSNEIIKTLLSKAKKETKTEIETLVAGGTLFKNIKQAITYGELYKSIDNIWSIMLSTGYLTIAGTKEKGEYGLAIPNYEIKLVYIEKIQEWFKESWENDSQTIISLAQAFLSGNPETAEEILNGFLTSTISIRDTMGMQDSKESFYHGVILGMLSNDNQSGYSVLSNREAGNGYLDIYLFTENEKTGAILEIKLAQNDDDYDNACNKALEQIEKRDYTKIFRPIVTKTVYKYGIGCRLKYCQIKQGETELRKNAI